MLPWKTSDFSHPSHAFHCPYISHPFLSESLSYSPILIHHNLYPTLSLFLSESLPYSPIPVRIPTLLTHSCQNPTLLTYSCQNPYPTHTFLSESLLLSLIPVSILESLPYSLIPVRILP